MIQKDPIRRAISPTLPRLSTVGRLLCLSTENDVDSLVGSQAEISPETLQGANARQGVGLLHRLA